MVKVLSNLLSVIIGTCIIHTQMKVKIMTSNVEELIH